MRLDHPALCEGFDDCKPPEWMSSPVYPCPIPINQSLCNAVRQATAGASCSSTIPEGCVGASIGELALYTLLFRHGVHANVSVNTFNHLNRDTSTTKFQKHKSLFSQEMDLRNKISASNTCLLLSSCDSATVVPSVRTWLWRCRTWRQH